MVSSSEKNGASSVNGDIGKVTLGGPHCLGSACANSFCPFPPLLACRWHSVGLSVRGLSTPSWVVSKLGTPSAAFVPPWLQVVGPNLVSQNTNNHSRLCPDKLNHGGTWSW